MLVLLLILESFGSSEIKFESLQLPMGVSLANTVVCLNKRINHSCTDLLLQINVRRREEFHRDQNIALSIVIPEDSVSFRTDGRSFEDSESSGWAFVAYKSSGGIQFAEYGTRSRIRSANSGFQACCPSQNITYILKIS